MINKNDPRLLLTALILASGAAAQAQYMPPPPPAPFPGFLNEWLRKDDPYMAAWDIGGSWRMRYEVKENGGAVFGVPKIGVAAPAPSGADFRKHTSTTPGVDNDNDYFMSKVRVRLGYSAEWYSFLAEGRDSETWSDDRNPSPEEDGPIDLHQAYFTLGNHKEFPLSMKVGRQELSYGDERLVGAFAWNNIGRVFDAAKVRWQNRYFGADFFTGRVIIPYDGRFNMPNDYDWFSGMYATTKLIPKQTTDFYVFSRNTAAGSPTVNGTGIPAFRNGPSARDIYTIGMRVKSNPGDFGPWDYGLELAGQFGRLVEPTAPVKSQDHEAFAAIVQGGYTWTDCPMTPRVGLEYCYGSGDSDPNDGTHETFENLFPTNHKFYGYMDFFSLQNIHDFRLIYTMKPLPRLSTAVEFHSFLLADTHDSLYNVSGARRGTLTSNKGTGTGYGINPDYGSYVGSEIDVIVGYALTKYAALEAGYGHFFVGDYVKDTFSAPTHGSTDADWVYLQTTFTF